jgi:hypothetical protein
MLEQEPSKMARHILLVMTDAVEGNEEEFNTWYDTVHLPEMLTIPGFISAQRFRRTAVAVGKPCNNGYLCVYVVDHDDLSEAIDEITRRLPSMQISDAIDRRSVIGWGFTELGELQLRTP